ncbi:hypothetical protein [Roseimicrobium sp. ORNL1]|uniref:hypothetical protein n=1 Tax=Roseimicrobium sp. ORNL1 TaxID=2711231 RepID=UPI0013E1C70A|nr:hypothetical protein [Roseimicrobium sp. ORNL1]QIF01977.1 hypothetical protein G5S37_10690 [Roseimicrobium sp. ORNL1]
MPRRTKLFLSTAYLLVLSCILVGMLIPVWKPKNPLRIHLEPLPEPDPAGAYDSAVVIENTSGATIYITCYWSSFEGDAPPGPSGFAPKEIPEYLSLEPHETQRTRIFVLSSPRGTTASTATGTGTGTATDTPWFGYQWTTSAQLQFNHEVDRLYQKCPTSLQRHFPRWLFQEYNIDMAPTPTLRGFPGKAPPPENEPK